MELAEAHFLLVPISSLKKMTVGMFLASMAFVVAAIVQVEIDVSFPLSLRHPLLLGSGSALRSSLSRTRGLGETRASPWVEL